MRKPRPSYGKRDVGKVSQRRVVELLKGNPLSDHFVVPRIRTGKEALTLLLSEQARYGYGNALEVLDFKILERNFKLLLQKYTPEEVARGIVHAASVANHPSTTKHVEKSIEWVKHQRS